MSKPAVNLRKINDAEIEGYYHNLLKEINGPAFKFLRDRHIGLDTIANYRIGYVPKYNAADIMRQRVVFPIRNLQGTCVSMQGRILGDHKKLDTVKYLHLQGFDKSNYLYGLYEQRYTLERICFLVEGPMDVLALATVHEPGVASFGTSVSYEQALLLMSFFDGVILLRDGDKAGKKMQESCERIFGEIGLPLNCYSMRQIFRTKAKDPNDALVEVGFRKMSRTLQELRLDFYKQLIGQ